MAQPSVLGIVLAGGAGTRLSPLTADRAKPAVPFGGLYRLIDFALSNLANASIRKICVLTQYKSHSLDRHITTTWRLNALLGNYVAPVPAQQRLGPRWQAGSADAIYQSLNLIRSEQPDLVAVAGIPVPRESASSFGIIRVGPDGHRIETFLEKPADPPALPGRPDESLAAMGNYIFDRDV